MFRLFKKKVNEIDPDQQAVIIEGLFDSGEEFGTDVERNDINELEEELADILEKDGYEYDGHDFGDGGFTLYMYGDNADLIFRRVEHILKKSSFTHLEITKRYGMPASQEDAVEKKFTV